MVQYFHKKLGRVVELVPGQQFSSHWNYYDDFEGSRVIRQGLPGIDLVMLETEPTPVLPENWGESVVATEVVIEPASAQEEEKTPTEGFIKLLNLNTETSPSVISLHLPGIGKTSARKICDRKPKVGGYKDFEHFKKINSDFNLDDDGWEKLKELVEF